MVRIKLNQKVIVTQNGVNKVGVTLTRSIKNKKRVFNVRLENGNEIPYVAVDAFDNTAYINSELTTKWAKSIDTNLSNAVQGNIRS